MLDALFSPVLRANYEVEATRFGKRTDLDKLVLTVETDGSVMPKDAVLEASNLMEKFFDRVSIWDSEVEEADEDAETGAPAVSVDDGVLVDELPLPTRTINALKKADVNTLGELSKKSVEELADIKNLGEKSLTEIKKLLAKEAEEK